MEVLELLKQKVEQVFSLLGYDKSMCVVSFSDRPDIADFQCNSAFGLAKTLHTSPMIIANKIVEEFNKTQSGFVCSVVGGFVNFVINNELLIEQTKDIYNSQNLLCNNFAGKTVVIDYGGANVAKPLHVGHLRSAVIGQALYNLAVFCGYKAIGDVHLGDWGLQMGLTIAYIMENYDTSSYFNNEKHTNIITDEILDVAYPRASAKSKVDEDFKTKAREITAKLQRKEKGYYDLYIDIREKSIQMVKKGYSDIGTSFDLWWGESTAQDYTDKTLNIFKDKHLLKESDGALIVEVAKDTDTAPMPPMIAKATSGADLYATTECATLVMRQEKFAPDEVWYLTDARQALHFEQVFRACRLAQIVPEKTKLLHFSFGTMNGSDGKPFKTRDGGVMKLEDLVGLLEAQAKQKLAQNNTADEDGLSSKIGVAALKFGDMINFRTKDIVFDVDRFTSFEGKTGPYILYSMVRIKSILRKCGEFDFAFNGEISKEEKDILLRVIKVSTDINEALEEKAPNYIAQALYDIASLFSTFYNSCKIISEPDLQNKNRYLSICKVVLLVMEKLCSILGMSVPDKM